MKDDKELKEFQSFIIEEAKAKGKDPNEYAKELGEEGMKEAYKRYLAKKLKKAQKALRGAKLQYLRQLNDQCPEGEELIYYKKGGSVTCGCKKKEDGGQINKTSKNLSVLKFKEKWTDKDEHKLDSLSKREALKKSLTPQGKKDLNNLRNKFKKAPNKKDYEIEEGKCGGKMKKKEDGGAVDRFKAAKCGSKLKKHLLGGSLNGIPFIREELIKVE